MITAISAMLWTLKNEGLDTKWHRTITIRLAGILNTQNRNFDEQRFMENSGVQK